MDKNQGAHFVYKDIINDMFNAQGDLHKLSKVKDTVKHVPSEMLDFDEPHEFLEKYHIDSNSVITDSYQAGAHKFSIDSNDG